MMPSLVRGNRSTARLVALPLALALSACLYARNKPQENILPTNYKPDILEMVHGSLDGSDEHPGHCDLRTGAEACRGNDAVRGLLPIQPEGWRRPIHGHQKRGCRLLFGQDHTDYQLNRRSNAAALPISRFPRCKSFAARSLAPRS